MNKEDRKTFFPEMSQEKFFMVKFGQVKPFFLILALKRLESFGHLFTKTYLIRASVGFGMT